MSDGAVFDISPDFDRPLYTGEGAFERNCEWCERMKGKSGDILIRKLRIADGRRCAVVSVDGMCDKQTLELSVLAASRRFSPESAENKFAPSDGVEQQFTVSELSFTASLSSGYISALTGDVLVIVDGESEALLCGYRSIDSRSVDESPTDGAVRGPHEAFTENLRTNTALIRRRISDPNLVMEHLKVGRRSHTTVALCYILGLTNPELIDEVRRRINEVDIDQINDSGQLEQLIEDRPSALLPQTDGTELPDAAAGELCAGRVAVIVNGSPYVLLLPVTISGLMKVSEDDYQRWSVATFVKLLRWAALIISVIAPSLYVAMVTYHPGMLPTDLLMLTAINRLNVPFSAFTEVLIIELSLELLREASIRMPKSIGTSLSIVGGIIIGDAAINAGLVSPLLIVVIGISTMAGFTIPSYPLASTNRLIKYLMLALSALLGLVGFCCGTVIWLSALVGAKSFGVDLCAPFFPFDRRWAAYSVIEPPASKRIRRPAYLDPIDRIRCRTGGDDNG